MQMPALIDAPTPIRLTVVDLDVLHRAGALDGYRRTELIDGVIVEMSPMGTRHAKVSSELYFLLISALRETGSEWEPTLGGPTIAIPPHDGPQPDVVVFEPTDGDGFVDPATVHIVMEVGDATLRRDLTDKRALYARAAIPEYWVVDVQGRQVHQFWSPEAGFYTQSRIVPLAGELRSVTLPELAIDGAVSCNTGLAFPLRSGLSSGRVRRTALSRASRQPRRHLDRDA